MTCRRVKKERMKIVSRWGITTVVVLAFVQEPDSLVSRIIILETFLFKYGIKKEMKLIYKVPKRYLAKAREMDEYFSKYSPILLVKNFTGRTLNKRVIIYHKPLNYSADFFGNKIYVDFRMDISYIFLCVCHELSHIILRQKPSWYSSIKWEKIFEKNKNFKSEKYSYSYRYALEQTMATLIQAACEQKAGLRPLAWSKWQKTFEALEITNFKYLFQKFKGTLLKDNKRYDRIEQWLINSL